MKMKEGIIYTWSWKDKPYKPDEAIAFAWGVYFDKSTYAVALDSENENVDIEIDLKIFKSGFECEVAKNIPSRAAKMFIRKIFK